MSKTYIRVDDRLIHGQIAVAWAQTLSIGEIIAIDDQTANNKMLQQIMLMGVSKNYNPSIISFSQSEEVLNKETSLNRLVIVRSPEQLELIIPFIKNLEMVYLGNIQKTPESKYNMSSGAGGVLFFSQRDIDAISRLDEKGIKFVLQMVPSSGSRTWEQAKKTFK
ncbi:MAG: PTS sugar transporter subunit IIB [Acholeplasmataceae bacterium]|nr:PTS sugar transporter subunit IIB [Acholeplasmataceae bacterium]